MAAAGLGIYQEEIRVGKSRRARVAVELALLLLLLASLLASEFLPRGAFGLPDNHPSSSQPPAIKGTGHREASGIAGGVPPTSALAFTHDFDGYSLLGGVADFGHGGGSATGGGSGNPNSHDPGSSGSGVGAA